MKTSLVFTNKKVYNVHFGSHYAGRYCFLESLAEDNLFQS